MHCIVAAQAADFPHEFLIRPHALIGAERGYRAFWRNQIKRDRARTGLVREQLLREDVRAGASP